MTVERITVTIERLPAGGLRFTMPGWDDWCAVGHGPFEIARAIDAAWVEADIATYARARGTIRDVEVWDDLLDHTRRPATDGHTDPDPDSPPRRRHLRAVQAEEARAARARVIATQGSRELRRAREWSRRADGMWCSPAGRWFHADSEHARRVAAILREHGEEPRLYVETDPDAPLAEVHQLRRPAGLADVREG